MLATIPEFTDLDFSHLARELTGVELVESVCKKPARSQQSRLLWFALLLSLLLHLSLLLFSVEENKPYSKLASIQTLHIDLLQPPIKKLDIVPEVLTEDIVNVRSDVEPMKEVIASPVPAKVAVPIEQSREVKPATRLVVEPLSAQELVDIVDGNQQQSAYESDSTIGGNVFHPGLRTKLREEASKPQLARVEDTGLTSYRDPSEATIVDLENGGCMKSSPAKIGEARNWYHVGCAGKNESETIMDRVNEAVNDD